MVNLTRAAFDWGLFGQANFSPVPAIELQAVGMANLPGSGMSQLYGEAGVFVGFAWLGGAKVRTGSEVVGPYTYVYSARAAGGARKKLGLNMGAFLDRHSVFYWAQNDKRYSAHRTEPRVSIDSVGFYGGIKYVQQTNLVLEDGAAEWMRFVFFFDVLYAARQSVEIPVADAIGPSYSPFGGRLGIELSATFGMAPYFRFEFGALPSMNGSDLTIFMMLGLSAADSLEWAFGRTPRRLSGAR
ncbi:MAG: hypothetical protein JNL79_14415 [Myxococcales bacterium]|nr:hypothetical protein [Myxococcales bacterium]